MSIDFDKPVQTRDGRRVEIYTIAGQSKGRPVVGEYLSADHGWVVRSWTHGGHCLSEKESADDLVNVPNQHTVWVNVFSKHGAELYYGCSHTRSDADIVFSTDRIACVEVSFTEGEGLE